MLESCRFHLKLNASEGAASFLDSHANNNSVGLKLQWPVDQGAGLVKRFSVQILEFPHPQKRKTDGVSSRINKSGSVVAE